jgi:hypothetical protein
MPSRRTLVAIAAVAALIAGLVLTVVVSRQSGTPDNGTTGAKTLQQQLADAGYRKADEKSVTNGDGSRTVTTQWWRRDTAPEQVILTADSAGSTSNYTVNNISFNGSDGKGNLDCQPKEGDTSDLATLIADADKTRTAVQAGTAKPVDLFPYGGAHVGCLQ